MRALILAVFLLPTLLTAQSKSYPPLKREPVLNVAVPSANPPIKVVHGVRIRFAPGQPLGLHLHPVTVVGMVTEGSFHFQPEGETERLLKTGDSFAEPAGKRIVHFDNASSAISATIVVYYLTDSDSTPVIKLLDR